MAHRDHQEKHISGTTAFPMTGMSNRIAQLIVLDMVLWPGVLFIGVTLFAAWQVRDQPVALATLLFATLFSVAVGVRQWNVMLRTVFPAAEAASVSNDSPSQEASPRPTGRGTTEQ